MEFTIQELFQKGGGFMWPLLILSIITVLVVLERIIFYTIHRYRVSQSIKQIETDGLGSDPLVKIGRTFIREAVDGEEHCLNVTEREASRLINQHERGLRTLALIAAISPLIGLLGTVWGMVIAFSKIAKLGATVTPGDFADGIWTGLLTTVAGLLVAIPAMSMAKIFEARVDKLVHDLNQVTSHLRERFFSKN